MKKILTTTIMFMLPFVLMAQDNGGDFLKNTGKIYVVVGVLLILFLGIVFFLFGIERRLKKMEEEHGIDDNY